jgi:hypothetical protein
VFGTADLFEGTLDMRMAVNNHPCNLTLGWPLRRQVTDFAVILVTRHFKVKYKALRLPTIFRQKPAQSKAICQ